MDFQLIVMVAGSPVVIEEWDAVANGMFNRTIVLSPAVGANDFRIRARASVNSGGCAVIGASLMSQQAKR